MRPVPSKLQRDNVWRTTTLLGLIVAGCSVIAAAQPPTVGASIPAKEQKGFNAISEARLRTNLTYIASDKLAGG